LCTCGWLGEGCSRFERCLDSISLRSGWKSNLIFVEMSRRIHSSVSAPGLHSTFESPHPTTPYPPGLETIRAVVSALLLPGRGLAPKSCDPTQRHSSVSMILLSRSTSQGRIVEPIVSHGSARSRAWSNRQLRQHELGQKAMPLTTMPAKENVPPYRRLPQDAGHARHNNGLVLTRGYTTHGAPRRIKF
jgi:hypothetical protein